MITRLQRELTRRVQVDPGWVDQRGTVIGKGFRSPSQGAAAGLWAVASPLMAGRGGLCQEDCEVAGAPTGGGRLDGGPVRDCAVDRDSAARLPELSVAAAGTGPLG